MNEEQNNSLEELSKNFKMLLKHIKLIITTALITTLIAALAVFVIIHPKYQSTSEIIVSQKLDKDVQAAEQQQLQSTDLQLVNTYKSILNSQTIGNAVKHSIGAKEYSKTKLTVDTDTTSQVISLNVIADSPRLATKTANKTADIFKKKINKIMNVNNVSIISKATNNKIPVSPRKTLSLVVGFIVGLVLGAFISILKEYNAKTIDNEEYITDELGLTDLGTISDIDIKKIKKDTKR